MVFIYFCMGLIGLLESPRIRLIGNKFFKMPTALSLSLNKATCSKTKKSLDLGEVQATC